VCILGSASTVIESGDGDDWFILAAPLLFGVGSRLAEVSALSILNNPKSSPALDFCFVTPTFSRGDDSFAPGNTRSGAESCFTSLGTAAALRCTTAVAIRFLCGLVVGVRGGAGGSGCLIGETAGEFFGVWSFGFANGTNSSGFGCAKG